MEQITNGENSQSTNLKYCKHCGERIPADAVICVKCGRQVEELKGGTNQQPNIIINNDNSNKNTNANLNANVNMNTNNRYMGRPRSKLVALLLCFFLGYLGAHKFYEGKSVMGLIYLFTCGLCFVGVILDLIVLLCKPSTYYV